MRLQTVRTLIIAVAASAAAATCTGDGPVAPQTSTAPPESATRLLNGSGLGGLIHVVPLQRITSLTANESVSATIGVFGGHLSLPNAGLIVIVPPFAVVAPTTFSVTAFAGSNVAYDFAPHGAVFRVPILALQDLRPTQAKTGGLIDPASLFVGYFPNAADVTSVSELLNLAVDPLHQLSAVAIWHFSGYTWSSGRAESPGDGPPQ